MKKKFICSITAVAMAAALMSGCGKNAATEGASTEEASQENTEETSEEISEGTSEEVGEEAAEETEAEATEETSEEVIEEDSEEPAQEESEPMMEAYELLKVGSLKGPTTMGLVNMMDGFEKGEVAGDFEFTMATQPDEIVAGVVSGDIDVALVPANVAAVLYNKTEGGVKLVDINTLGVLYCVTGDESITSIADLAGKTVITTGQGATPEYAMNFLLEKNGVTDCTLEFKSEATEIAAVLQEDSERIAVLPQPFATVAQLQNQELKTAFSLTDEWSSVAEDSQLITGVTVVRSDYYAEHQAEVDNFLREHEESAKKALEDIDKTAELVASYGIIEKPEVAKKALPFCNIVCISGDEADKALSGYLQTLYDANPKSVGGALPAEDFYDLSVADNLQ